MTYAYIHMCLTRSKMKVFKIFLEAVSVCLPSG